MWLGQCVSYFPGWCDTRPRSEATLVTGPTKHMQNRKALWVMIQISHQVPIKLPTLLCLKEVSFATPLRWQIGQHQPKTQLANLKFPKKMQTLLSGSIFSFQPKSWIRKLNTFEGLLGWEWPAKKPLCLESKQKDIWVRNDLNNDLCHLHCQYPYQIPTPLILVHGYCSKKHQMQVLVCASFTRCFSES